MQHRKAIPRGVDKLPASVLYSRRRTGNEVTETAGWYILPSKKEIIENYSFFKKHKPEHLHHFAQMEIASGNIKEAAAILMAREYFF